MALEKKRDLRKIEITFTDGKVHEDVHCEFITVVLDDGEEIARKNHRIVDSLDVVKDMLLKSEKYIHPELSI